MDKSKRIEDHVLSLLPSSQFHSCVLTTFSFDFNFFYHDVRSQLNRADIINTNVLVDDAMLHHYLGSVTGYAHDSVRRFAITGIPSNGGVFHPKIGLFFGDKEKGFMIIGSGNLTACGHGRNQELWGAFHIDGYEDTKAPLFKSAWEYLRGFKNQMSGISKHKIEWIEQHAGWVSKIPDTSAAQWIPIDNETEAQLLINSSVGIWESLTTALEGESITEATVISPFFDARGTTLSDLCTLVGDAEVHLIVQKDTCAFPDLKSISIPPNLVFHDWATVFTEGMERYVHAKLLHIKTQNKEYCLIGSSNLTSAGMGSDDKSPVNEEASILLRSRKDILKSHLSIKDRGRVILLPELFSEVKPIDGRFSQTKTTLRVRSIDRYSSTLHIYMDMIPEATGLILRLFDGWEENLGDVPIGEAEYSKQFGCYKASFTVDGDIFFAQLFNSDEGDPVSNKAIVHDAKALLNTNPDPENKKLEKAIAQIETGQTDLLSLLRYINPEDIVDAKKKQVGGYRSNDEKEEKSDDGSGMVLDYDAFTQQQDKSADIGLGLYSREGHSIDRILELVKLLLKKAAEQAADDQSEDEEAEKDNVEDTEGREDEEVEANIKDIPAQKPSAFKSNQQKLCKFFNKYIKTQAALIKKKVVPSKLDHSLFAVVLHLLIDFYKKPVLVLNREIEKMRKEHLLGSEGDFFGKKDYRRFLAEIIGQHSIILTNVQEDGINQYECNILKNIKESAYWNAICAIALAAIEPEDKKKPRTWIWEMFMNLRDNCGLNDCAVKANAVKHLSTLVNIVNMDDKDTCLVKMVDFWEEHERLYQQFQQTSGVQKGIHEVGVHVYSKALGFCHISASTISGSKHKIELARPGYPPDTEAEEFPRRTKYIAEMIDLTVL
ncbi:MAG: hypothetical protein ABFR82_02745 [Nitrospirota bacterium]